jgi:hypothetical protein
MRGKRARTVSSSPQYERVIWVEEKTARGSKITARVSGSPKTPKIRKLGTPHSKKRRMDFFLPAPDDPSTGDGHLPNTPIPMKLKTKSGKVSLKYKPKSTTDSYLSSASSWATLRVAPIPGSLHF